MPLEVVSRWLAGVCVGLAVASCGDAAGPRANSMDTTHKRTPTRTTEKRPKGNAGAKLHLYADPVIGRLEVGDTISIRTTVSDSAGHDTHCRVVIEGDSSRVEVLDSTRVVPKVLGALALVIRVPTD